MNCFYHPDREVVGMCVSCGKPICAECKVVLGEKFYCNPCADKIFSGKAEIGATVVGNTSGQGSLAVIPQEIRGWNWGAFLLNWIWAIGNSVWLGLLALIPWVGWVMAIVLGVKGSEWAWQKKKWDSIEPRAFYSDARKLDERPVTEEKAYLCALPNSRQVTTEVLKYQDDRINRYLESLREGELLQSIYRIRPLQTNNRNRITVFVFTAQQIDGVKVQIVTSENWHQFVKEQTIQKIVNAAKHLLSQQQYFARMI